MRRTQSSSCNSNLTSTNSANYSTSLSAETGTNNSAIVNITSSQEADNTGMYTVLEVAKWFLNKSPMTHKKLQKLCYYAQAWSYALNNRRLIDSDFQAWVHGPVSPALYEFFKPFGYNTICMKGSYSSQIDPKDEALLEDVWETYGDHDGNSLEALSHREAPWINARQGYLPHERCTVVIDPESMREYYKAIYVGE